MYNFEQGVKMLTLSSMEILIVECSQQRLSCSSLEASKHRPKMQGKELVEKSPHDVETRFVRQSCGSPI